MRHPHNDKSSVPTRCKETVRYSGKDSKMVTVAVRDVCGAMIKLLSVSSLLYSLQAEVDFIFLDNIPIAVMFGRPTFKLPAKALHLKTEKIRIDYHGQEATTLNVIGARTSPRRSGKN